jgi:hypothetical protein
VSPTPLRVLPRVASLRHPLHCPSSLASSCTCLSPQSLPLRPDAAPSSSPAQPLPLFHTLALPVPASPAPPKAGQPKTVLDWACSVGGPVWALDWRPRGQPHGGGAGEEYLAVGTRDPGSDHPRVGVEYAGPGAVQLWRLPPSAGNGVQQDNGAEAEAPVARPAKKARAGAAASQPEAAAERRPVAALVLAHSHGTVWDLKWRPHPPGEAGAPRSLGLLAVACGDGTLCVVSVPDPRSVPPQAHGATSSAHQPLCLTMCPAWTGSRGPSGERRENGCLPWCLAWHPQAPHDRLLAGCTDGTVLLYNLGGCVSSGAGTRSEPVMCLLSRAQLPLRAVCWQPPAPGSDQAASSLVAAAGDEGVLSVWDPQQQATPVWRCNSTSALALALAWWPAPRMLVTASDNGRLGIHNLRLGAVAAKAAAHKGVNGGSMVQVRANVLGLATWGLDLAQPCPGVENDPVAGTAAVCGADGGVAVLDPVGVLTLPRAGKAKKGVPPPKAVKQTSCTVAWLQAAVVEGGDEGAVPLVVTCGGGVAPQELVFEGQKGGFVRGDPAPAMDVHKAVATRPEQALHRCRWSGGEGDGQERWLATAGAAGVLRLLRLRLRGRAGSAAKGDDDDEDEEEVVDVSE